MMKENTNINKEVQSIDKILYSIKEKKFDEERIKKDLKIDINIQKKYSDESAVVIYEGNK